MIYILTAIYAEAHAFIHRFQLKKELSQTRFQVFANPDTNICLMISGAGSIPASVAVGSICTEYHAEAGDFLLNIGVCGQIWNKNFYRETDSCQIGKLFLCSKIRELATGKTFYPDILYRHEFAEAQIITGSKPYSGAEPIEITDADFYLYDMEAAAVYQAGAYYFGPHQISFLKVVSDNGNAQNVTPRRIEHLIDENMEDLAGYITNLQAIAQSERQDEIFQKETAEELERLCLDMHCSRTMSESLRQHLHYCILSGVDYASVLEEMYREGNLPCKDKREGKQRLEELKKRLL